MQFAYIDWRQKEEEAYQKLLNVCRFETDVGKILDGIEKKEQRKQVVEIKHIHEHKPAPQPAPPPEPKKKKWYQKVWHILWKVIGGLAVIAGLIASAFAIFSG